MKRLLIAIALWLACIPAYAQVGLPFPGPGAASVATYQGPGNIVSGATIWGSCARVYQVSLASTSTSLCDLVANSAPTTVLCTLRATATGFVDLSAYCTGGTQTPAQVCAALPGAVCNVSKVYNQVSPGTNDFVQVTASNQPKLGFSAISGLPGLVSTNAGSSFVQTAAITQAPPYSISAVWERTGGTTTLIGVCGGNLSTGSIGHPTGVANEVFFAAPTGSVNSPATVNDNAFHAIQGVSIAGAGNSFLNYDGTDVSGTTSGTISAVAFRISRASGAASLDGIIMECGIWPSGFSAGNRTAINSNAHSATSGYNF